MDVKKIFSDKFQNIDLNDVVNQINQNGYFVFEKALTDEAVSKIIKDGTSSRLNINKNDISGVYAEKQYFFTNLLAVSSSFYDFVTSNFVLKICEKYMGESFRLSALRYYETFGKHHMQWHTDNKTDKVFANFRGLIFICYLSDVNDGQFQYIEESHKWSRERKFNDYTDDFIKKNYLSKIKNFKYPKGSVIIYNTHGLHRAKPVFKSNFIRKSIFFQIDNITDNSEPILINTKFINKIDDKIAMFLGFGKPSNYRIFPKTSLNTLPVNRNLIFRLLKYILYRFCRNLFNYSPNLIKQIIKNTLKKFK